MLLKSKSIKKKIHPYYLNGEEETFLFYLHLYLTVNLLLEDIIMIKFGFSNAFREGIVTLDLDALQEGVLISFDQAGFATLHAEHTVDVGDELIKRLEVLTGKTVRVTSNLEFENFTVAMPLGGFRDAFRLNAISDLLQVRWEVRDTEGHSEWFTLPLKIFREWEAILDKCATFSGKPAKDKYHVSPEVFLDRYEVRGGAWRAKNVSIVGVVGTLGLTLIASVLIPNVVLAGLGSLFLVTAYYEGKKPRH